MLISYDPRAMERKSLASKRQAAMTHNYRLMCKLRKSHMRDSFALWLLIATLSGLLLGMVSALTMGF
jgi:hypothetical protein